jgi:hypothetical protein
MVVLEGLTEALWGRQAVFRDLYGNLFDLLERRRWMNTMAICAPVLFRRMTAQQALPPDGFAAGEAQSVRPLNNRRKEFQEGEQI